ncbi:MAG TPA: MFS transporter [Thermoanaerobaculia bacterium]|nr:MFS transporter [Thermoanaerobaculia bacterium]
MSQRAPLFTADFLRLWLFAFVTFFSAFQLLPTVPFRILALGGTKAMAGTFLALYTYACAFSAPLTGSVADHFGRRRVLLFASLLFIVFSLGYGSITRIPLLLAVATVHGVCWSGILSSSAAIMSESIPESRRTEGLAYWGMASTAAIAVAPLAGLVMMKRTSWFALCAEMAVLSAAMFLFALRLRPDTSAAARTFPPLGSLIDWRVTVTALSLFVISFGYGGITSYVALLAGERRIEPASLFFSVFAVTILVSRVAIADKGDRFGPVALLIPSLLIVPVALAVLAVTNSRAGLITAAALYGIGFGGAYPAFMSFVLRFTDPERRGTTFGSVIWAFDTGIGSGSLITGIVVQHAGYRTAYLVTAAVSALAVPLFLLTSRSFSEVRGAELKN